MKNCKSKSHTKCSRIIIYILNIPLNILGIDGPLLSFYIKISNDSIHKTTKPKRIKIFHPPISI